MGNHRIQSKEMWAGRTHIWRSWEPRRLLFFVHGFGGENTATWFNFPPLMLDDQTFREDDLLFYGYESREQSAKASADILFQDCNHFLSKPDEYLTANDFRRSSNFAYDRVIFIAHSLGAPVVRSMMLKAIEENAPWVNNVSLIFFAPATPGARAEGIAQLVADWRPSGLFALARIYFLFNWPVIEDLKVKSSFLKDLHSRTERKVQEGFTFINALKTFPAAIEKIIDTSEPDLPFDRPFQTLVDRNHNNVCKPITDQDQVYVKFCNVIKGLS